MYVSKKLINILWDIKYFLGTDDKSIYFAIKQEIKFNPKYKGMRFMSEQKFYECLAIGEKYYDKTDFENISTKYHKFVDFYIVIKYLKKNFKFHCKCRFYDMVQNNKPMTQGQSFDLIKILALHQQREFYA